LFSFELVERSLNFICSVGRPCIALILIHGVDLALDLVSLHIVLLLGHVLFHLLEVEQFRGLFIPYWDSFLEILAGGFELRLVLVIEFGLR
jgi:hypothetical protein